MESRALLAVVLLTCAPALCRGAPFSVEQTSSQVNITFGGVTILVDTSPWRMTVVDAATDSVVLEESSESDQRLGFGRWTGEYFNKIYEGYLFRVGLVVEWHHATVVKSWAYTTDSVSFLVATSDPGGRTLSLNLTAFQARQFSMHTTVQGQKAEESNRMAIGFLTPDDEGFYGFGERFDNCNQRGHRVGAWLEDGSWGLGEFDPDTWKLRVPKGEESTYGPMPVMLSSRGYGIQMDTSYRTVFDLAKGTEGLMKLEQETNQLDMTFFVTETPRDAFALVVEKNGRSLIPPAWEFSPWNQLESEVSGTSAVQRIRDFFFKYDIPTSHDVNTVHFFPDGGERGRETALKLQNEELLALGVKSTCYFNPMLEQGYTELYNVAVANNYFVKTKDGLPYNYSYIAASHFHVSQVDFTSPAAVKWYQAQLQRALDMKFNGWMYDYGEYTPPDSVSSDGTEGLEMHNEFALLYQKAAFDHLTSLDPTPSDAYAPDYVFYVRSGYLGSQRYTWAHWTGDPSSDWSYASGLPAQVTASLNIGLTGMPFSGSDIGGFEWYVDPAPDLELWSRWTAVGCVSGLMHEQGGGKGRGPKSHIFDFPNGTAIWRKFAKLRTQLFPYLYTQAHTAHETGLPIMQHHLLNFWNDPNALKQCQQFMLGDSFLAAPVVKRGATDWDVYLPTHGPGRGPSWMDVGSTLKYDESDGRYRIGFSGYFSAGQYVTVAAPLDSVPLFVLAGSVVPVLDPRVHTLNNATNTSVVTWASVKDLRHAWIFADSAFSAAGATWDGLHYTLKKSSDKVVQFSVSGAPHGSVHIPQITGPWEVQGIPAKVSASESLPAYPSWQQLLAAPAGGFSFDPGQLSLWIKLVNSSSAVITLA